jgi:hypothetical protein
MPGQEWKSTINASSVDAERKETMIRKVTLALTLTGALAVLPAAPALADISTTQTLPTKACRLNASGQPLTNPQGNLIRTNNAYSHIPPVPGNGNNPNMTRFGDQTNAHNAVPGQANVMPCGHGG